MILISELGVRLSLGQADESEAILKRLQQDHLNEPGVAEQLQYLLTLGGRFDPQAAAGQAAEPPAEAADSSGGLWTPDSPGEGKPSSGDDGGKSKLWVPGMD